MSKTKNKQQKKELTILTWLIAFFILTGLFTEQGVWKAHAVEAPPERYTFLPINPDKEMDCKTAIFIHAFKECNGETYCVNDLMGMAYTESRFDCNANGDFGASHGPFQIHLGYHKDITQEQARNPEFAVKWTYNRLKHYGYPKYRSYALMKHNGTPNTPATLAYLESINNY